MPFAGLQEYLHEVTAVVQPSLQPLVGLYLHGSLALDRFTPGKSDIDLLVVVNERPAMSELEQLGCRLNPQALTHPAPLDLHVVVTPSLTASTPRWEAWYSTHPAWGGFRTDLEGAWDQDLFLMFEITRQHGSALVGPPPVTVFPQVPLERLLAAADDNLGMWESLAEFWLPEEAVLTACRAWYLAERGRVVSKLEAAEWARVRWNESAVVADAILKRKGGDVKVSEPEARRLLGHVRRILGSSIPS